MFKLLITNYWLFLTCSGTDYLSEFSQ